MAAYDAVVKVLRGTPTDLDDLMQTYIETLDSTNNTIIGISVVGDNNFATAFITHNTT